MAEEINKSEVAEQKFNWLPWILILCLVFVGLYYLVSTQDAPEPEPASTTTSTTTEFTYEPEDVELKEENGVLTAYAKGQKVPYSGLVYTEGAIYVCANGEVDPGFNGIFLDNGQRWIVQNGQVNPMTNGVVPAGDGNWYFVKNGAVDENAQGTRSNKYGTWYIVDGKVQFDKNGLGYSDETYLITNGKVNTSATGVVHLGQGAWGYVKNGILQKDFTGVQKNNYGSWYIKDGFVDFHYSGETFYNGDEYSVSNGKATLKPAASYSSGGFTGSGSFNVIDDDDDDYYSSSSSGRYVGNSSTGLFHIVGGCSNARGNEYFDYYNQARAAGYDRCPNCPFY